MINEFLWFAITQVGPLRDLFLSFSEIGVVIMRWSFIFEENQRLSTVLKNK